MKQMILDVNQQSVVSHRNMIALDSAAFSPIDINRQRRVVIVVQWVGQEHVLHGELFEPSIAQQVHEGALEMGCEGNPDGRNRGGIQG